MEVGGSRPTSMEVSGRLDGNTWTFPRTVDVEASIAFIYPYILPPASTSITNFPLFAQDFYKGLPTFVRSTCMEFSTNFHGKLRGSQFTSMEAPMEVRGSIVASMEKEVGGSTWKFPLSVEVEASFAFINCSFLEYISWKFP